jgi:hypothetical protein
MPKLTRQSPVQKRIVRQIQRWLAKHEHPCAFDFKLHRCGLFDDYNRAYALCRTGVVISAGGGCVVEHWTEYTSGELLQLFNAAKRVCQKESHECTR